MARSSILVLTLLLAPCASLKMKTEAGLGAKAVPNAVNCLKSSYYGIGNAGHNSCWIYHHYTSKDDGSPWTLPDKDGFMDTDFYIDGISDTVTWKVSRNSWSRPGQSHFKAETSTGEGKDDLGVECGNDWGIDGTISHCVNGAEWQAARWVERSYMRIHDAKHALKSTKKSIGSYKKAAQVIGKKWRDDTKAEMKAFRDELNSARDIMRGSRGAKYDTLRKKLEGPSEDEEKLARWQDRVDRIEAKFGGEEGK